MKKPVQRGLSFFMLLFLVLSNGAAAVAAEEQETFLWVGLDSIYELAYAENMQVKIAQERLGEFYAGLEDLEDQLDDAWSLLESPDPGSQMYGSMVLDSLVPQQASSQDRQSAELSAELAKRQAADGARAMLEGWYSAQIQCGLLQVEAGRAKSGAEAGEKMAALGLQTSAEVSQRKETLRQLEHGLDQAEDQLAGLTGQLANYLGVAEAHLRVQSFSGFSAGAAQELFLEADYDADLSAAVENSLSLQIQKLKATDSSGHQRAAEKLILKEMESQLTLKLEELYRTISHEVQALEDAEADCRQRERDAEFAELKYQLGLASLLERESAQLDLESQRLRTMSAQLAFSTALDDYQSVRAGNWQPGETA